MRAAAAESPAGVVPLFTVYRAASGAFARGVKELSQITPGSGT